MWYNCGVTEHLSHDYTVSRPEKRQDIVWFYYGKKGHMCRDCYHQNQVNAGPTDPVNQACVNAIILGGARFNITEQQNLKGTHTLYNSQVLVLFDARSMNPFIAYKVV